MTVRLQNHKGFTLLELLVALAIFSMLSMMAYGGLQTVIKTRESAQLSSERLTQVQLAILSITNDLRQAVLRKVRDKQGDYLFAMQSGVNGDNQLEWSRTGYMNPARLKRSHVQRVAYLNKEQKIFRLTWPVLDRAQDTTSQQSEILNKVVSMEWRFLNQENSWLSSWPETGDQSAATRLPRAVEINIELEDWGKIRRLVFLAESL